MKSISRAALGLVLSIVASGCDATPYGIDARSASRAHVGVTSTTGAGVVSETGLQDRLREVFLDRAAWTRLEAIALAANAPDVAVTRARLMRAQAEVGDVIARFYGRAAGDRLTRLLDEGVDAEDAAARAALAHDDAAFALARRRGYASATRVATDLASSNPAFSPSGLSLALRASVDDAIEPAADDADASVGQNLALADIIAGGIVTQFPRKVAGPSLDTRAHSVRVVLRDAFAVRGMLLHEYVVDPPGPARARTVRLLDANASSIARPIGFFHGAALATELAAILRNETRDATRAFDAALAGDEAALDAARNDWGVDDDRFAMALAHANGRVDRNIVDRAMRDSVAAAIRDARDRREGAYDDEAAAADVERGRMARVGDVISGPIVSQFAL